MSMTSDASADIENPTVQLPISRHPAYGHTPAVLADILQDDVNMAIWQRQLSDSIQNAAVAFMIENPAFTAAMTVSPADVLNTNGEILGAEIPTELADNIAELVDMFCYLFGLERAGLRLATLDRAMCPRFHVDYVPCRLITTYYGIATEWLRHDSVDRSKLGIRDAEKSDVEAGLYQHTDDIQQLTCGDVALLKGERWIGNENAGLVHRSPEVLSAEKRLLLTLDFSD